MLDGMYELPIALLETFTAIVFVGIYWIGCFVLQFGFKNTGSDNISHWGHIGSAASVREGQGLKAEAGKRQPECDHQPERSSQQLYQHRHHAGADGPVGPAVAAFRQAMKLRQKLADAHPDVSRYKSDLAKAEYNLSRFLTQDGRSGEEFAAQDSEQATHETLAAADAKLGADSNSGVTAEEAEGFAGQAVAAR
ncbi:MAG: hypothetical protein ACK5YR_23020 [Pirellula sp.]|jgi:hypothetical protein